MIGRGSRLAACIAIALVAVMCLSVVQNFGGGDDPSPATVSATGELDEYVKVGWLSEVQSWNPLSAALEEDYIVSSMVYSSLFTYDEDWNGPVYDLAVDVDQTTYVDGSIETLITISTDAYFRGIADPYDTSHPVTALDVAATFNMIKNTSGGTYGNYLNDLSYFEPVQRGGVWDQVRVWCDYTKATIFDDLACIPILPMYEGSIWTTMPNPLGSISPTDNIGSGPFLFEDWMVGAWYKFQKAPNYHGELDYGDARDVDVPGVLFIVYGNVAAMCIDLNVGNIDCVDVTGDLNAFRDAIGGKLAKVNIIKAAIHENGITDIAINAVPDCFDEGGAYLNRHPALQDPIVRKAIMMTLNKDYIVEVMLDGLAVKAASVLQPGYWQADIDEVPYDPQGAMDMLIEKGWIDADNDDWLDAGPTVYGVQKGWFPEGTELSGIRCQAVDTDETYKAIALGWPGWADDAGIELVGSYESETTMVNKAWYACDYDIWIWHWAWNPEPISGALSTWLTSEIEKAGDNCQMPMGPWWAYLDENGNENVTTCPYIDQDMIDEYDIFNQQTWDGRFSAFDQNLTDAAKILDPAERKVVLDKLQQWIYDSCTENPPYYDLGLYAYTDFSFTNWGDWRAHNGLSITATLPWIWFMLEPVENKAPVLDDPLDDQYTAYTTAPKRFDLTLHDIEGDEIWVNFTFGDGSPVASNLLTGDTTSPTMVEEYHQYVMGGVFTLAVSICDRYYSASQGEDVWRYIYREAPVTVYPEPNDPPYLLAFGSDKPSPISVDEYVIWNATAADPDSGTAGTDLKFTWDWDDGSYAIDVFQYISDNTPVTSVQSHAWNSPGTYVVTVYVTDGIGGEVGEHNVSVSSVMVVTDEPSPEERSLSYRWYDMFNVPYGEWYDHRPAQVQVTDSYPYMHLNYLAPMGNLQYFTNMRLDIIGENLPEINMNERPLFLPFLGSTTGGTAELDWYLTYATHDDLAPWPVIQAWNDGWISLLTGTTTLDMEATMSVLGMPENLWDSFDAWWLVNGAAKSNDYLDWLNYEGDVRLDIYNCFEYQFADLDWTLSAEKVGDQVVITQQLVSWGGDCLMARWLRDAFMDNAEWSYEDFSLSAQIGPNSTDIQISTVVEDAVFAWESVYTDDPCWAWRGHLGDYIESSLQHPVSDYDPYADLTYLCRYPGNGFFDEMMLYDYTPGALNLSAGETMTFVVPDGEVMYLEHNGSGSVSESWAPMTVSKTLPGPSENHNFGGSVSIGSEGNEVVFTGPIDMWTWSKYQVNDSYLMSEWDRLDVLPFGIPWLEFGIGTVQPPVPDTLCLEGLPDIASVGQPLSVTVSMLDQYGFPYHYYEGTVTFSSSDGQAVLPADYTFVSADGGVHTFLDGVVFGTEGVHSLTVTDFANPSWTDTAYLEVTENQLPVPIAHYWPENPMPQETVYFDASESYDPDGTIVDYLFEFPDYGHWGSLVTYSFNYSGVYSVNLTVWDNDGASATTTILVEVVGERPVAVISAPTTGVVGEIIEFDGTGSYDPDGYLTEWHWYFSDGHNDLGPIVEHAFNEPGSYWVELFVVDNDGIYDWTFTHIDIFEQTGVPPVAVITYAPTLPTIDYPTLFDGSGSFDPDGTIVQYIWQFGDGTVAEGAVVFHTYEHSGLYLVQLTVVDNSGLSDDSLTSITVASVPEAMFVYYPANPAVGENVTFYAYGSYDQSEIVEYTWSFGDGTYGNGWQVEHTYDAKGSYEVVLTVKNNYGILDSTAQTVRVDTANCGVKGVVINNDYSAIQNARVYLYSHGIVVANTMTDTSGSFSLLQLLPGQYDLVISKGGYTTVSIEITLSTGTVDLGTIMMTPSKPGSTASDSGEVSETLLWPAVAAAVAALGAISAIAIRKRR